MSSVQERRFQLIWGWATMLIGFALLFIWFGWKMVLCLLILRWSGTLFRAANKPYNVMEEAAAFEQIINKHKKAPPHGNFITKPEPSITKDQVQPPPPGRKINIPHVPPEDRERMQEGGPNK